MKTEGLTFLEAVQALKDGKCRAIRRPEWAKGAGYKLSPSGLMDELVKGYPLLVYPPCLLSGDWQLIDPVPEKRTVKGWVNLIRSFNEYRPFQCSPVYGSKEGAMDFRNGNKEYFGDPLYIEHEYEVKP